MSRAPLPVKTPGTKQISDYFSSQDNYAAAVQSNFSGAGVPSDVVAYETYADTTTNLMMQRNSANTGSFVCGSVLNYPVTGYVSSASIPITAYGKLVVVDCSSGSLTITLPPCATATIGWWCTIKRVDTAVSDTGPLTSLTIDAYGTETIDFLPSLILECEHEYITLRTDGTKWFIVNQSPVKENLAINGAFDYNPEWVTLASNTGADNYAGGLWKFYNDTMTYEAEIVENSTSNSVYTPNNRLSVTYTPASTKNFGMFQFFDDLWRFSGKTITLSFEADFKESLSNALSIHCWQHFGTGGSTDVNGENFNISVSSGMKKYYATFTVPTVVGKTIAWKTWDAGWNPTTPATNDFSENAWVAFGFTLLDSFGGEFEIQKIKIEESSFPTRWVQKSLAQEKFDMSYYFHTTYNEGLFPGSVQTNTRTGTIFGLTHDGHNTFYMYSYPQKMRRIPFVKIYAALAGTLWEQEDAGGSGRPFRASSIDCTETHMNLVIDDGGGSPAGGFLRCQAVFDARFSSSFPTPTA
jgi:hypothetical protein